MAGAPHFPDPDDPAYHPTEPEFRAASRWARIDRRWLIGLGAALGVLFVLLGIAQLWLRSDAVRGRIVRALTSRIDGVQVGDTYSVDLLGRVTIGPVTIPGEGAQPAFTVDTVRVRPRYHALLAGRAEPASIRFGHVVLDAGLDGKNLEALAGRFRRHGAHAAKGHASAALPLFLIDHLELRGSVGSMPPASLVLDGVRLESSRQDDGRHVDARAQLGKGVLTLNVVRPDDGPLSIVAKAEGVGADVLPQSLRARLPFQIDAGQLSGTAQTIAAGLGRGALRVSVRVSGLTLEGQRLADGPVGPLALGFDGDLRWNAATRRVTLERGTVFVGQNGQVQAQLTLDLQMRGEPHFEATFSVDQLAYQAALEALPHALLPPPEAPRISGALSASVSIGGPLRDPDAWKLETRLDLSQLKEEARAHPSWLRDQFIYRAIDPSGREHQFWVGPKNPTFVPIGELPNYVPRAVTTSEDAGFFAHHGFDFDELKNSIVADEEAGRAVRGGSTITQQLAKNLFLTREKTYARKIREALITIALEASLTKQRMLEIYLNVIEWGPGIYGIGAASQHYFGKDARKLTPKEAAFLATIIPNPIRFHIYYERGALTDAWEKHVEDLLGKMNAVGIITDEELETARLSPIEFARPTTRPRAGRQNLRPRENLSQRGP